MSLLMRVVVVVFWSSCSKVEAFKGQKKFQTKWKKRHTFFPGCAGCLWAVYTVLYLHNATSTTITESFVPAIFDHHISHASTDMPCIRRPMTSVSSAACSSARDARTASYTLRTSPSESLCAGTLALCRSMCRNSPKLSALFPFARRHHVFHGGQTDLVGEILMLPLPALLPPSAPVGLC